MRIISFQNFSHRISSRWKISTIHKSLNINCKQMLIEISETSECTNKYRQDEKYFYSCKINKNGIRISKQLKSILTVKYTVKKVSCEWFYDSP